MGTYSQREEDEARALAYIASILFSCVLAAFSLVTFAFRALLRSARSRWTQNWPTTPARITTCDVKAIHGRFIDYALAVIGYAYEIEDNYYSGYLIRQFWDEQRAWTFADGCRDKSVLANYKLGRPQTSVLWEIDQVLSVTVGQRSLAQHGARFGLGLAILWALRNVSDWAETRLNNHAGGWPSACGTVEYAEPVIIDDDDHWGGELHYSYSVDGQSYANSFYFRALDQDNAKDLVAGWRNRKVIVRYFPGDPRKSVLLLEEQDQSAASPLA